MVQLPPTGGNAHHQPAQQYPENLEVLKNYLDWTNDPMWLHFAVWLCGLVLVVCVRSLLWH